MTIKHAYLGAIQNLTSHLTSHREFVSRWLIFDNYCCENGIDV